MNDSLRERSAVFLYRPLTMMEIQKLSKTYSTVAGELHAVRNVSLTIKKGEVVAIKGRSGSGKSTLLNLIGAIDTPTSGQVIIDDVEIHCLTKGELARWRGTNVGFVFQFFQLLPTLTAVENVMLPMDFCRTFPARKRRPRALGLLERVGVAEQADKVPTMLSGGQQQRVAVARALANDPSVILADEPTGNLDSVTAEEMIALFREMAASGTAVIIATHDREVADIADSVVTLIDGAIGFPASNMQSLPIETAL